MEEAMKKETHFTYMRKDLVTRTKWLKGSTQWSGIIFSWSETRVRATHLQLLIKAHFTCQGLADPVDEGFGFLSRVWAGACDLKLHHFTTVILSAKQNIESSSNTNIFYEWCTKIIPKAFSKNSIKIIHVNRLPKFKCISEQRNLIAQEVWINFL